MDENKNAINPEEASEMQKASEAELQAALDGGDTDIFVAGAPTEDRAAEPIEKKSEDVSALEEELNKI